MKKIISVILAAAMLLALGVTAFADTSSSQPETVMKSLTVEVQKWWYDDLDSHPAVTVDIYRDDEVVGTVTLSEENDWHESVKVWDTTLYSGDAVEERYKYSVKERAVAGYEADNDGQGSLDNSTNDWVVYFTITNEPIYKVEIPVSVTVKQTGNAAPGSHTFYYSLEARGGYVPQMLDGGVAAQSEYFDNFKISYTGALKGDENGFSVTTNGKGTAKGTIVIEGSRYTLYGFFGRISKRAQTAPDGWTYDESVYNFYIYSEELEGGGYGMTYEMEKPADDGSTNRISLGKGTAEYVNTYEANRITTGSDTIKIPAKEENPNTGAPVYAVAAAVIALGAAAIALKIRK